MHCIDINCRVELSVRNKSGRCEIHQRKHRAHLYYERNKTVILMRVKEYTEVNSNKISVYKQLHYQRNKDNYKNRSAKRQKENPALTKRYARKWRLENKGAKNADTAKRRANNLQRLPKWLTKDDLKLINNFIKQCPPGYHTDHILPLNGRNVSGLHVLSNLQYLPAIENLRKSNKF